MLFPPNTLTHSLTHSALYISRCVSCTSCFPALDGEEVLGVSGHLGPPPRTPCLLPVSAFQQHSLPAWGSAHRVFHLLSCSGFLEKNHISLPGPADLYFPISARPSKFLLNPSAPTTPVLRPCHSVGTALPSTASPKYFWVSQGRIFIPQLCL